MILKSLFKAGLGIGLLSLTLNAAAATKTQLPKFEANTDGIPTAENVPYSADQMKKEMAAALARGTRGVASSANFEDAMSAPMKQLRTEILAVRTSDQLEQKLKDLSAALDQIDASDAAAGITAKNPYKGADRDFRFYAAQVVPLQCLRGFVWKFTPLAEKSGMVESRLVTSVYKMAHDMQIMTPVAADLPTAEARQQAQQDNEQNISYSVFDYLTKPYNGAVLFGEGYDMQAHLMNSCYKALSKSAERIERIDMSSPIVFDNKIFFGVGTFPDDLDRYRLLGEAERHFSLAMKYAGMNYLSFFRAYSIKDYFKLQTELGKLYAADAFPGIFGANNAQNIDGVSLQKRVAKIRSFTNTFILYHDGPIYLSKYSWPNLVRSVQELNLTWAEVKGKPENQRMVINPAFLNAVPRATDETLKSWTMITDGPTAMHSRLTDRVVNVDLRNFYLNANPVRDLKEFLPVSFDNQSPRMLNNTFTTKMAENGRSPTDVTSKYSQYRNWYYGQPTAWNMNAWKSIFPDMASGDVPQTLRTVNQAWGGGFLALPLMQFIR